MNKIYSDIFITGFIAIIVFIFMGLLFSVPLWILWNWLMPDIFGLPTITIIQSFGLQLLLTLLYPKPIEFSSKDKQQNSNNVDKKLEEVLVNMTTHFRA